MEGFWDTSSSPIVRISSAHKGASDLRITDLGISVAYWLSFGLAFINNGYSDVRWRFLLAFQCFPALLLFAGIKMLPDSPRFLASVGRYDEAREVLEQVRGKYDASVETEFLEIVAVAKESKKSSPLQFAKILVGKGGKRGGHLGRRAWLCLWLQIMASWTGITVGCVMDSLDYVRFADSGG